MSSPLYIVQRIEHWTVIEIRTPSLMDPVQLEEMGQSLNRLIDAEDRRLIILDFSRVEYLSSQAIGIVIGMHKRLATLPHSKLVLCGVGPKLMDLMRITRLDKKLTIKPTQHEAVKIPKP